MALDPDLVSKLAEQLAELVKMLVDEDTLTYEQISRASGVSRNVLYYFAVQSKKRKSGPTSIKASDLSNLIRWFNETNFELSLYSSGQRDKVAEIRHLIEISTSQSDETSILGAFTLGQEECDQIKKCFPNIMLGLRLRGTSGRFQVSLHKIDPLASHSLSKWKMIFLQGRMTVGELQEIRGNKEFGAEIPRHEQSLAEINGLATIEENVLTCLGRRSDTNILNLLNIMNVETADGVGERVLMGSLSTYSRHEAISRSMIFIDLPDGDRDNLVSNIAHLGDITFEEAVNRYDIASDAIAGDFHGYTLTKAGGIRPEFRER